MSEVPGGLIRPLNLPVAQLWPDSLAGAPSTTEAAVTALPTWRVTEKHEDHCSANLAFQYLVTTSMPCVSFEIPCILCCLGGAVSLPCCHGPWCMEGQERLRRGLTQPPRQQEDAPWGQKESHREERSAWARGRTLAHTQSWPPRLAGIQQQEPLLAPFKAGQGWGQAGMVTSSGVTPCSQVPKCNERASPWPGPVGLQGRGWRSDSGADMPSALSSAALPGLVPRKQPCGVHARVTVPRLLSLQAGGPEGGGGGRGRVSASFLPLVAAAAPCVPSSLLFGLVCSVATGGLMAHRDQKLQGIVGKQRSTMELLGTVGPHRIPVCREFTSILCSGKMSIAGRLGFRFRGVEGRARRVVMGLPVQRPGSWGSSPESGHAGCDQFSQVGAIFAVLASPHTQLL